MAFRAPRGAWIWATLALALTLVTDTASGATIDLGHPTFASELADNIGTNVDRGAVFDALTTFTISSAGIFLEPLAGGATAIAVDIFVSNLAPANGNALHGATLASGSATIVDAGAGFYDVPINFTFNAGSRYDLVFRSLDPGGWGFGANNIEFYDFDFFSGHATYGVGGLVSVLDGSCHPAPDAGCGNYSNSVMPHTRFETVSTALPEPLTLTLLGTGLFATAVWRRRRQ
jgi:hypothetical protein